METRFRTFNCRWCHSVASICSHCDCGNLYCSLLCKKEARRKSLQVASKKYQNSRQGKFKHADRQKRYRSRQNITHLKVTHQSFNQPLFHGLVSTESRELFTAKNEMICSFCGKSLLNAGALRM
jgi:hypothetical protein